MLKFKSVFLAGLGWLIFAAQSPAQDTIVIPPVPPTVLETLENTTGQVIIKATAPVGSLTVDGVVISVGCKEDTVPGTSRKEHGVTVGIASGQLDDRTVIDYDELNSLLSSMDYLSKINWSVTSLPSFDASHATKGGLRVAAFSSKRAGQIEFSLRSSRMPKGILLTSAQFSQLQSLLGQAKSQLDALRK